MECVASTRGGASLRGTIVEAEGRNASGQHERYLALTLQRAACATLESAAPGGTTTPRHAERVQLVLDTPTLQEAVRAALNHEATVTGTLLAGTSTHHSALLLDVQMVIVSAQGPIVATAPEPANDPARSTIEGTWRVVDFVRATGATTAPLAARRMMGRTMRFGAQLQTPWRTCEAPRLRHEAVALPTFLNDARLPTLAPARAGRLGLRNTTLERWTAICTEGANPTTDFYFSSAGRLLVSNNGAWFVLARLPSRVAPR
jgi:hypothetical protein